MQIMQLKQMEMLLIQIVTATQIVIVIQIIIYVKFGKKLVMS